jgi:SWI/SNF-related matrix-associated actin-dependent regulator 1 of chromatin subfamily A
MKKVYKHKSPILLKRAFMMRPFIKLQCPYSTECISEIKAIPGRQWKKESKYWLIPLTLDNCITIAKIGYYFDQELNDWAEQAYSLLKTPKIDNSLLNGELYQYQKEGVSLIEKFEGRCLLADDMGLGKTLQAIAWSLSHPELKPVVIVTPASLKYNWELEITKWAINKQTIQVLEGTDSSGELTADYLIINYDILQYWGVALRAVNPKLIIFDEIHYIKNSKALRTKACFYLKKGTDKVIGISGTPIESKPIEIYNILKIIKPELFPNAWAFRQRYCDPKHNGFGWTFKGASNAPELHSILMSNLMIRRIKQDVLKHLPDKVYSFVPLPIDNKKEYKEAEDDFKEYLMNSVEIEVRKLINAYFKEDFEGVVEIHDHKLERLKEEKAKKASPLTQIEVLKQLAANGKLKAAIEWIENFLESGEKLVVFCEHIAIMNAFMTHFGKIAVKIDGSTPLKKRSLIVKEFQENKKIKLFIGNKAAETGFTLTAASNVVIYEFPWNPGALAQRIDRLHRIGQKYVVNVYYLLARETIDIKISKLLDEKMGMITHVIDGKETKPTDLIMNLIKTYTHKQ